MSLLEKIIKAQRKQYHNERYINFRKEADKDKLNHDNFIDIITRLKADNYQQIPVTTLRNAMPAKSFTVALKPQMITLAVFTGTEYKFYYSALKDAKNVFRKNPMPEFKKQFFDRTGKTLTEAFGKVPQYFKFYVPQPIYYQNYLFGRGVKIKNVCKEDFSSHYPSCAVEKLPNATTIKTVNQYVKPDNEYEFAFYPDTGNVAVYNEFDSHDYISMQMIYGADDSERTYKTDYYARETRTILMKASTEKIEELKVYYDIKNKCQKDTEEYDHAKLFINMFLGKFEQNSKQAYDRLPFAHLAAVIKWRANIKMFRLIKQIGETKVIQVCVDGLLHLGPAFGNKQQVLGNLICEEENAILVQRGINQYIVFGTTTHKCHAGLDLNIESDNIKDWAASPKADFAKYVGSLVELE